MLLVLVWGMHFLSNKQLIADNEKYAIYRHYQFMEEKRCISKSINIAKWGYWIKIAKKATPFYNIFSLILLYNESLQMISNTKVTSNFIFSTY